jgi:hypothetical protein
MINSRMTLGMNRTSGYYDRNVGLDGKEFDYATLLYYLFYANAYEDVFYDYQYSGSGFQIGGDCVWCKADAAG